MSKRGGDKAWKGFGGSGKHASSTKAYHNGGVEGKTFDSWYTQTLAPHFDEVLDDKGPKSVCETGTGGSKGGTKGGTRGGTKGGTRGGTKGGTRGGSKGGTRGGTKGGTRGGSKGGTRGGTKGGTRGGSKGGTRGGTKGGTRGGSKGGTRGGTKGGTRGGTKGGTRGGTKGGTRGGTKGGTRGGTKGGTRGGSKGGTRGGTKGGTRGGTKGGTRGGTKGGTRGGTKGGTRGGTKGGTRGGTKGGTHGGTHGGPGDDGPGDNGVPGNTAITIGVVEFADDADDDYDAYVRIRADEVPDNATPQDYVEAIKDWYAEEGRDLDDMEVRKLVFENDQGQVVASLYRTEDGGWSDTDPAESSYDGLMIPMSDAELAELEAEHTGDEDDDPSIV